MSEAAEISRLPSATPQTQPGEEDHKSLTSSDDKRSIASHLSHDTPRSDEPTFKSRGVVGVEAIARYAAHSKQGKYCLYSLGVLIFLLQWVVSTLLLLTTRPYCR
jgi:hypothetical protein